MKFGKYLASRQLELPEYSGHFIDYKALKKLIKQLAIPATSSSNRDGTRTSLTQQEIQETLKENKASFFFRVERELDKVNALYLEKQANLAVNLDVLIRKKNELFNKSRYALNTYGNGSTYNGSSTSNSNFKNSISYLNLYQNFKKIHQDLIRLQQFIELNETGFSKVVKKWDKRSKSHTKELFIQSAVNVQPVFYKNEINELSDIVTQSLFDLESIMDGDYSVLDNPKDATTSSNQINILHSLSRNNSITNITHLRTLERKDSTSSNNSMSPMQPQFQPSRNSSISGLDSNEIDELYLSFVNVATIEDPDRSVLKNWIEKIKVTSKSSHFTDPVNQINRSTRAKLSKIFFLAISNVEISDTFLESFLNLINYDIDFEFISEDLNNNRNIFHECCAIQPALSEGNHHFVINNGVKVYSSIDNVNKSRSFILSYMMQNLPDLDRKRLLVCKDFNGRNGLHYASQYNRLDIFDIVLPYFPAEGLDSLDNESMSPLLLGIKHNNFDVIRRLVELGANLCPEGDESKLQYLPINYACKFGDFRTLEYLLSHSEKDPSLINRPDVEGLLPLHVISRSGHDKLIRLFITHGADVNKPDGLNDWTPIFYAALEGHMKTAQRLVEYGAKVDILDKDGYNVLYYCVIEGHINVLNKLLSYGNKNNFEYFNEKQNSTDGQSENSSLKIQIDGGDKDTSASILDDGDDSEDSGSTEKNNAESIPDLQLPPPIIPLRRYGHNFLEQKVLIELIFPNDLRIVELFNSAKDLNPGRITITSNISDMIPRNIILPGTDESKSIRNCIFQTDVESLHEFRIDFEVFPKFGTRLIAKTTALSFSHIDTVSPEIDSIQLPLFDLRLRNVGELKFNYQVIFPYSGTLLETSKFDTYWKSSTSVLNDSTPAAAVSNNFSPSSINSFMGDSKNSKVSPKRPSNDKKGNSTSACPSSFVTATSLSGEYLRIKVCLLNDGTPVVCPQWSIPVLENIELYLPNLSIEQLSSITNSLFDYSKVIHDLSRMTIQDLPLIKKLLKIIYMPLDILLEIINVDINLNLEIIFPSLYELEKLSFIGSIQQNLNKFIDFTLNDVFDHVRSRKLNEGSRRSIIFLSSNALICKILNWKQPNFPVFLIMSGITYNNISKRFESRSTNGLIIDEKSTDEIPNVDNSNDKNNAIASHQEKTIRSIKDGTNFTTNNNLIGLIISVHLLNIVPKLIPLIKSRGLVLVASSDITDQDDEQKDKLFKALDSYTKSEINGLRFDDVLSFNEDISM
ncbi:uncharacterized protein PRCAT00003685001 [Priceomyces carsonii]|uniref:uncharacterized protein n=1 Tax=Priceomyces carsonii TaxID=28549 RepID=UPI002EDB3985|nr:unnamed protein product [Priceomyces carsonii]